MRKTVAALAVIVMTAGMASASTIVRDGSDYDGYANPGSCKILVHDDDPASLHVNCRWSKEAARIRFRFLRGVGEFAPADVSAVFDVRGGDCSRRDVQWQVPTPRTLRVWVPPGCYVHLRSVSFSQ